jgi:hypothetical protein
MTIAPRIELERTSDLPTKPPIPEAAVLPLGAYSAQRSRFSRQQKAEDTVKQKPTAAL